MGTSRRSCSRLPLRGCAVPTYSLALGLCIVAAQTLVVALARWLCGIVGSPVTLAMIAWPIAGIVSIKARSIREPNIDEVAISHRCFSLLANLTGLFIPFALSSTGEMSVFWRGSRSRVLEVHCLLSQRARGVTGSPECNHKNYPNGVDSTRVIPSYGSVKNSTGGS